MKYIKALLSALLILTLLISVLCLPANGEALKLGKHTPVFNVYKAEPENVKKDGVIGEHEYHELILDLSVERSPLYVIFGRNGTSYEKAIEMLPTMKYYFSWDEINGFNLAVRYAPTDMVQLLDINETGAYPEDGFMNNCALSAALSETQKGKNDIDTLYYAIAKRTDNGKYLQGWYNQLGRNGDFTAEAEKDFVIEYSDDGYVTYEWSIPFDDFMEGDPEAGRVVYFTLSAMAGNALDVNYTDCYGIGLGDRSYLCAPTDSTRHAQGILSDKSVRDAEGTDPADKLSDLFSDTDDGEWYAEEVLRACNMGLLKGNPDGTFAPNNSMTRAEFVTLLYRGAGNPSFKYSESFEDVNEDQWFGKAVAWASRRGYVNGYGDGKFHPDDPITREQIAAIFQRYARYTGKDLSFDGNIEDFPDHGEISSYAILAMRWANGAGLIEGSGSGDDLLLAPKSFATRAEVSAMVLRYIDKFGM